MTKLLSMNPANLAAGLPTGLATVRLDATLSDYEMQRLLTGDVLVHPKPCKTHWGGGVTARMCLPLERELVWSQLTNYPRWVEYFPDLIRSEMLSTVAGSTAGRRLYQVARKSFLMFSAQVEIYLQVFESIRDTTEYHIRFCMEKGSFRDFSADLMLQNYGSGTLLTYSVQATPIVPIPVTLIQEAIRLDLPSNMQQMRQVLCDRPFC